MEPETQQQNYLTSPGLLSQRVTKGQEDYLCFPNPLPVHTEIAPVQPETWYLGVT